jgi:hypothetical protein
MDMPAFVLGNGPTLPSDLSCLDGLLTIGVNRITHGGYEPTAVVWVDSAVARECGPRWREIGTLVLGPARDIYEATHVMRIRGGEDAWKGNDPSTTELCFNGNTAVGAARFAIALGCDPVYLVGCGCAPGAATNFYGNNRSHTSATYPILKRELDRLLGRHDVVEIPGEFELRYFAARHQTRWSKEHLRKVVKDAATV